MSVVVRRYIDILIIIITFPYSTCISSFCGQHHPYFFVHFLNVFSFIRDIVKWEIFNITVFQTAIAALKITTQTILIRHTIVTHALLVLILLLVNIFKH